ncbi:nitrile hydratase accessory protein [Nodosilinea sp. LEGE 07298]|uniref:nitrile hydratase accessory protein n=1 Tax=Nodosilinea sp. LEGE 07298 TaxID=2777970 RepID=UPI00187E5027|nr:nitrile hydratase accessory protein [Nodosilinea sp. LEGE 07298]MBE9113625.1 nitrile hydratase accessory protein [Nodosilinea sp. LEGE 07298]
MQIKFEQFAAASMLGSADSPPRDNGEILFQRPWEGRAFGMAIALSKKGHYEWEDFRQGLIESIAEWESTHCKDDPDWDYYLRWLASLENLVLESSLVSEEELEERTRQMLVEANATLNQS